MNDEERLNPEPEMPDLEAPAAADELVAAADELPIDRLEATEAAADFASEVDEAPAGPAEAAHESEVVLEDLLAEAADAAEDVLEAAEEDQIPEAADGQRIDDLDAEADEAPAIPDEALVEVEEAPDAAAFDPLAGMEIDAALAAVASLDILARPEDAESDDYSRSAGSTPEEAELVPPEPLVLPPLSRMQRGEASSVIPALLLIGLGGWLTFALTTTGATLDPLLLLGGAGAVFGLALLGYWFSSARTAIGALFAGLLILVLGGAALLLAQPDLVLPGPTPPLIVLLLGLVLLLTGLFAPRELARLRFLGMLVVVSGLAAWAVGYDLIPADVQPLLNLLVIPALLLILVILLVPARRRDAE